MPVHVYACPHNHARAHTPAGTTFLLLGIDQIAIEIEQPLDVLPIHIFAANMSRDVAECLGSWLSSPPLPDADDDESALGAPTTPINSPLVESYLPEHVTGVEPFKLEPAKKDQ